MKVKAIMKKCYQLALFEDEVRYTSNAHFFIDQIKAHVEGMDQAAMMIKKTNTIAEKHFQEMKRELVENVYQLFLMAEHFNINLEQELTNKTKKDEETD